jgi:flagellar secretion chaperone FliS
MGNAANAYGAYRSAEVNTVSQKDLIVRLYEGSERFLNSACLAMDSKDFVKSMNECRRARDIFIELLATLNFEKGGEFALRLKDLYSFFILQISEGSLRKNPEQCLSLKLCAKAGKTFPTKKPIPRRFPRETTGMRLIYAAKSASRSD